MTEQNWNMEPLVATEEVESVVSTDEPLYVLKDMGRTFKTKTGEVQALRNVNLEIFPGEFVTIQGPTGGGKSTLLQLLGGLEKPSRGELAFKGEELTTASKDHLTDLRAHEIGFVFQSFNLLPTLSAAENVEMGLEPLGLSSEERTELVSAALGKMMIEDRGDHLPGQLSGGQQQRAALARAIAKNPAVLLADEPTGNLDETTRDEILTVLQGLNDEGLTLIVVTHDSAVAARASRRLRIVSGKVSELVSK